MIEPVHFRPVSDQQQLSDLDEQRLSVEPDRRTATGDARDFSRRDVDDEDVLA
jgi:hypothetical protein